MRCLVWYKSDALYARESSDVDEFGQAAKPDGLLESVVPGGIDFEGKLESGFASWGHGSDSIGKFPAYDN